MLPAVWVALPVADASGNKGEALVFHRCCRDWIEGSRAYVDPLVGLSTDSNLLHQDDGY